MLHAQQSIYIGLERQEGELKYHLGTILASEDGCYLLELDQPVAASLQRSLAAGATMGIYFDHRNKFMHQQVHIESVDSGEISFTLRFSLVGEMESADNRAYYRAMARCDTLTATVNGYDRCDVLDVSSNGCAIRSARKHRLGETIAIAIEFHCTTYTGTARVQSVTELGGKQYRYGLSCTGNAKTNTLRNGLQRICTTLQRSELRRVADAA